MLGKRGTTSSVLFLPGVHFTVDIMLSGSHHWTSCFIGRLMPPRQAVQRSRHRPRGFHRGGKEEQRLTEGRYQAVSSFMGPYVQMTIQVHHGQSLSLKVWRQKLPTCQVLHCTLTARIQQFVLKKPHVQLGECCLGHQAQALVLLVC